MMSMMSLMLTFDDDVVADVDVVVDVI